MASENLTFDVLARDRASATFNRIGQSTAALESRFTRLTRAATGIATTLVGAQVGRSVLDAADKFELSRSRLESITKNIGQNFGTLSKQVGSTDDQMAKFGFTSADTEGALASLESVTRNPIKAFKDLALAADIARGRNIGLSEATLILQRVETGHVAQLAKLGIATKDAAGHTLTQAQALQMLTDLYGGSASRFADTFAGKQAAVGAEMKNSAAQIGVALLPAAVDLANVLQHDVLPPIEATAKFLDRNRQVIEPLAKAVLIGVAAWKVYGLAARGAAELTALVGLRATNTAERIAAASAIETAATRRASATILPDLRAVALAEDAAGVAARRRALTAGAGALGVGAVIAGSAVGGRVGGVLTGAGTGALAGAGFGPEGALIGAVVGGGAAPIASAVQNAFSTQPKDALTKQALSGAAGYAVVAKQLAADLRDLNKVGGNINGPGLGALVKQETAALRAADAEKLLGSAVVSTADKIQRQADEIVKAGRISLDLKAAQDGLRSAMHAAAQTAADDGRALAGNSDAALANRDALRNQVAQIFSVVDAMKAHGASAANQSNMLDILTQAVETNAIKLYGDKAAVDAFLASLGLIPGEAANAVNAVVALDAAMATRTDLPGRDVRAGAVGRQGEAQALAAAKASAKKIGDSFTSGYTPVVSKAATAAAKSVSDSMNKAVDKVNNDLQTMRDAIASTRSTIAGFAGFNPSGTDTLGASGANTDFTGQKRAKAAQLEQFASLYARLSKAGLNADDLHEFVGLGPAAIPAMQTLLSAGRSGIRQENALDVRINRAAGAIATRDAASQNLALLHRDLQTLPVKQARALAAELRHMGLVVNLREADRRNGKRIVFLT